MPVPNTFGTATSAIPLSQLDANFATPITLGNTAIQLGNTVTTLNNMTLANVTISSGTITITNVAVTTANVSGTANISTLVVVGNETVGGNTTITGNITAANANVTSNLVLSGGTANGVAYLNTSKVLTTGSALTFSGTTLGLSSADSRFTLTSTGSGQTVGISIKGGAGGGDTFNFIESLNNDNTQAWYLGSNGTSNVLAFKVAGSETMRLTSTSLYTASTINVGIGTSLPKAPLHVVASAGAANDKTLIIQDKTAGNAGEAWLSFKAQESLDDERIKGAIVYANNGSAYGVGNLLFCMNSAADNSNATTANEKMRLDSSGNLIQSAPTTAPTLSTNGTMVFNLTSNTNLRVSVRGSDGVTRTANLTLA